jgi:hypothetical protein
MNLKEYYKNRLNELMEQEEPPIGEGIPRTYPTRKWDPVERSQARDSGTVLDFTAKDRVAIPPELRDHPDLIRSRNEIARKDNEIAANKFKTSIGLYPTSSAKEGEEIKAKAKTAEADRRKASDEAGEYDVYKNLGRRHARDRHR